MLKRLVEITDGIYNNLESVVYVGHGLKGFTRNRIYTVERYLPERYGVLIRDDKNIPKGIYKSVLMKDFRVLKDLKKDDDRVSHPSHYTWLKDKCGIEVIDITRNLDFDIGNAVKYLLRAGHKSEEGYSGTAKTIEDLKKAIWYINDKINTLENG